MRRGVGEVAGPRSPNRDARSVRAQVAWAPVPTTEAPRQARMELLGRRAPMPRWPSARAPPRKRAWICLGVQRPRTGDRVRAPRHAQRELLGRRTPTPRWPSPRAWCLGAQVVERARPHASAQGVAWAFGAHAWVTERARLVPGRPGKHTRGCLGARHPCLITRARRLVETPILIILKIFTHEVVPKRVQMISIILFRFMGDDPAFKNNFPTKNNFFLFFIFFLFKK